MLRLSLWIVCFALFACAARPAYVITLKDGRQIRTRDFPLLNDATGYYRGESEKGELFTFKENEVASIVSSTRKDD